MLRCGVQPYACSIRGTRSGRFIACRSSRIPIAAFDGRIGGGSVATVVAPSAMFPTRPSAKNNTLEGLFDSGTYSGPTFSTRRGNQDLCRQSQRAGSRNPSTPHVFLRYSQPLGSTPAGHFTVEAVAVVLYIVCHTARLANASASAREPRVYDNYTRIDLR